jgi:hypothetical protein
VFGASKKIGFLFHREVRSANTTTGREPNIFHAPMIAHHRTPGIHSTPIKQDKNTIFSAVV